MLASFKQRARSIKRDTYALYIAGRDPRTPWYVKLLAGLVVAYALSPIDLIPDFVPVLGYLDDLIIIPAGLALIARLIPAAVLDDARARAPAETARPATRWAWLIVVAVWLLGAVILWFAIARMLDVL